MYQDDFYNPTDPNEYDDAQLEDMFEKAKRMDKGYNVIYRKVVRKDGKVRNKRIEIYTSSGTGSAIRDAETGEYYPHKVGSPNEELYFKVSLATGECTSANGSNTLFYCSPQHYENHLKAEVDPGLAYNWEKRRDKRLAELNSNKVNVETTEYITPADQDEVTPQYKSYKFHKSLPFTSLPIDGRTYASVV